MNLIHYGFGRDYLKDWGREHAYREVIQNFIDFGYFEDVVTCSGDLGECIISNGWQPENLEWLRVGNSQKNNVNAIGKHGEGVKMAFMILLREGYNSRIMTPKHVIYPKFVNDQEIGECFCFEYEEHGLSNVQFSIRFEAPYDELMAFKKNIIRPEDVLFDDKYFGQIVNKPRGNIYCGSLFVCNIEGITAAYNIRPAHLPLDRDRSAPRSFDLEWACSRIQESQGKFTAKDLSNNDFRYVSSIPKSVKETIQPRLIGNSIEYTYKNEKGKVEVISNQQTKEALKQDSFFTTAIRKLKKIIAKQLGLYDMLMEFQDKHVRSKEAQLDFELILEKVGKEHGIKKPKETHAQKDARFEQELIDELPF